MLLVAVVVVLLLCGADGAHGRSRPMRMDTQRSSSSDTAHTTSPQMDRTARSGRAETTDQHRKSSW